MNLQEEKEALAQFRKENFQVKCETSPSLPGEIYLSITHNGYQWRGMSFNRAEAKQVLDTLTEFLENEK